MKYLLFILVIFICVGGVLAETCIIRSDGDFYANEPDMTKTDCLRLLKCDLYADQFIEGVTKIYARYGNSNIGQPINCFVDDCHVKINGERVYSESIPDMGKCNTELNKGVDQNCNNYQKYFSSDENNVEIYFGKTLLVEHACESWNQECVFKIGMKLIGESPQTSPENCINEFVDENYCKQYEENFKPNFENELKISLNGEVVFSETCLFDKDNCFLYSGGMIVKKKSATSEADCMEQIQFGNRDCALHADVLFTGKNTIKHSYGYITGPPFTKTCNIGKDTKKHALQMVKNGTFPNHLRNYDIFEAIENDEIQIMSATDKIFILDEEKFFSRGEFNKLNTALDDTNEDKQVKGEDCSACEYGGKCISQGVRTKGMYCDIDNSMKTQREGEDFCENNFECKTNFCLESKCVKQGFFKKILSFFNRLF